MSDAPFVSATFRSNSSQALRANGASVVIDSDGKITATPASGQNVSVAGDLDVTGTITGTVNVNQLQLEDDEQLQFGDAPDYWWEYESAGSRLRLRSSDIDGGGSNGDILRVDDGGQAVEMLGQLLLPDGSESAPAIAPSDTTNTGFYFGGVGEFAFANQGTRIFLVDGPAGIVQIEGGINSFKLFDSDALLQLGTGSDPAVLRNDAADTLALRRGTNANTFRIYETYDGTNDGYLEFLTQAGDYIIRPQATGTATARNLEFQAEDGSVGMEIGTVGELGFYGVTTVAQPTTAQGEAAFVENSGGTAVNVDSTFGGYTLQQIVQSLQDLGLLA